MGKETGRENTRQTSITVDQCKARRLGPYQDQRIAYLCLQLNIAHAGLRLHRIIS